MRKNEIKDNTMIKIIAYPDEVMAIPRKGIYNLFSKNDCFRQVRYRLKRKILNDELTNRATEFISEYDNNKKHTAYEKTKFNRYEKMLSEHNESIEELKKLENLPDGEWMYFLKTADGNEIRITKDCYFNLIQMLCINGDDENVKTI